MNQMMLASILHPGQISRLAGKRAGKLPGKYKVQTCQHEPQFFALLCKLSRVSNRHSGVLHSPAAQKTSLCACTQVLAAKDGFLLLWATKPESISKLSTLWQDPKVNSFLWLSFLGYLCRTGQALPDKVVLLCGFCSFKN